MPLVLPKRLKLSAKRKARLPIAKQVLFFKRICHILNKGYPILEALKMTGWDPSLKSVTESLIFHLTEGDPIDSAFKKANFSTTVTNFLYFGRVHHDLPSMFKQCEKILQVQRNYVHKLKQVLRYPLILLVFLIIAFSIIKKTILPNFLLLFQAEESQSAPFLMIYIVNGLINGIGIVTFVCIISFVLWRLLKSNIPLQKRLKLYQKVPPFRIYKSFTLSFLFTTHLSSLLSAGLTLKQSLEVISQHSNYEELSFYSHQMINELAEGMSLGQSVHSCTLLRTEVTTLFHQTNNDLGTLCKELEVLAEFLIDYIQEMLTKWIQLIQPLFFIIIALFVVLIYSSIMFPLYQWMEHI